MTPTPAPKNILLCTLGASWAVVAEIFGWLAPQHLDLYAHHPARAELDALRLQMSVIPQVLGGMGCDV